MQFNRSNLAPMMSNVALNSQQIVPMTDAHLSQIRHIEHQVQDFPWSDKNLNEIQGRFDCHRVLLKAGRVLGFYYAQNIRGEVSLLNIAVTPLEQGHGYGKHLLSFLLDEMMQEQAESIWLEVRESNLKAISLYEKLGFNEVTRRFDYYPSKKGKEDALVMTYSI